MDDKELNRIINEEYTDQEVANIINAKFDSAIAIINEKRQEMLSPIEDLYDATVATAKFKRRRVECLIGKFYECNNGVFMVLSAPLLKHTNKTEKVQEFIDKYSSGRYIFNANKWLEFEWDKIPVLMISFSDSDEGCLYSACENDDCKFCYKSTVSINYTTVKSNACVMDEPVEYFGKQYKEITRQEFAKELCLALSRLQSVVLHTLNDTEDILKGTLVEEYGRGRYDIPIDINDACTIVDFLMKLCVHPEDCTKIDFDTFREEIYDNCRAREKAIQNYYAKKREEDDSEENDLEDEVEAYLYNSTHEIVIDDDEDYDLGI